MKRSTWFYIAASAITLVAFQNCASNNSSDAPVEDPNKLQSDAKLEGQWDNTCQVLVAAGTQSTTTSGGSGSFTTSGMSMKMSVVISGSNFAIQSIVHGNDKCTKAVQGSKLVGTFVEKPGEKIDATITSFQLALWDNATLAAWNEMNICGLMGWQKGVYKDISIAACADVTKSITVSNGSGGTTTVTHTVGAAAYNATTSQLPMNLQGMGIALNGNSLTLSNLSFNGSATSLNLTKQ